MFEPLQIELLGAFTVLLKGQPIRSFRSAKSRALLAYLAAQPDQEHSRATLATLFWGDLPDTAAKTNLRVELSNLKRLLGAHPALDIARNVVCFHSEWAAIDATAFQAAVTSFLMLPLESQNAQLHHLSAALDHYQGDFLRGFHLVGSPDFEDRQLLTRERLHELMMQALDTVQARYAEQARWRDLAATARRQLAMLPWHEPAHRFLMQALSAQGDPQAALAQYAQCCNTLQRELGVDPAPETVSLAARLRGDAALPVPARHNLPSQTKSLIGRADEVKQLGRHVQTQRLITLLGVGGVGKSTLAQAVALNALHHFADGVWFVPLANVTAGDVAHQRIALAIAAAIGFQVTDFQTPLTELTTYLADKKMLLILDNWDHLTASAEHLLNPLFARTPVRVLATSRVRLMLEEEMAVPLGGLTRADAFALFIERAQRIASEFSVAGDRARTDAVSHICAQVAGLPLGIELAASWVEHFSVEEISQSVARIEIEPQQMDNHIPRHHKISSIFEYSWRLLSPQQQQILARFSIFRGGFDRESAATVAESTLSDLSILISHSLVQRVSAGRYDLHPLIQEFAAAKLTVRQETMLQGKHSMHYLSTLVTTPQDDWARLLVVDFENVRSAWQRAVWAGDLTSIRPSVTKFAEFIARFGLMTEGETFFRDAVTCFGEKEDNELVAQLLHQQWRFTRALRGLPEAATLAERVLMTSQNPELQIQAHLDLANAYAEAGEWDQANGHFEGAEALLKQSSDLLAYILVVETRIHINALHFRGDFAHGIARLQEMLALLGSVERPHVELEDTRFRLVLSLSLLAVRYGDYALAIRCGLENLTRVTSMSHRQKRIWILLDLALGEQFAGLFDEAAGHNLEALSLAEEISAIDDVGLLSANLCLTLRQTNRLNEGLAYGLKGADLLKSLGIQRQEGQARNRVGHTLLALRRWIDADAAYAQALAVWEPLQHPNRFEAMAGRAVTAFHLNRRSEALSLVDETLTLVERAGLQGVVEPVLLLLNCEQVLRRTGQMARAQQTLQQAAAWINTIAGRISDDRLRQTFLNRPDNQAVARRLISYQ